MRTWVWRSLARVVFPLAGVPRTLAKSEMHSSSLDLQIPGCIYALGAFYKYWTPFEDVACMRLGQSSG
jgi:hypothetical protein